MTFFSLQCLWAHWNIANVFWYNLWIIYLVLAIKDIVQTVVVVSWPGSARQQFIFCGGCLNAQQWQANIHESNHHFAHTRLYSHLWLLIIETQRLSQTPHARKVRLCFGPFCRCWVIGIFTVWCLASPLTAGGFESEEQQRRRPDSPTSTTTRSCV